METPETPLAHLGFQLIAPSRALQPYVQSYWYFRRDTPLLAYREEYMHPRGGYGLVFNFGDVVRLDGQIIIEPLFLDGATTISRKMGFLDRLELLGIRFQEGGAYPVLGVPLGELRNEVSLLDVLNRREFVRLHAQLHEEATLAARIHLLEAWLMQRLALGNERNAIIPTSLALLREQVRMPISHLAQEFAISQRQLERLYQNQVGMSPKQYAQLLRVETARLALKRLGERSTMYVAADLGFYDQSHFIREFSAVVGMPPHAYAKRARQ